MSKKYSFLTLAALVLPAISTVANAEAVPFEGRFYEVFFFESPDTTWETARLAAEAQTHEGVKGRLATINTIAEDNFLHDLIDNESATEYWVGGFQEANVNCVPSDPAPEPRCGWKWINGELIDPSNDTGLNYTNWASGEPNNTSPGENHLAIGRFPQIGWNDEAPERVAGYIVEYGDALAPVAATECTSASGCPLGDEVASQTLFYPAGTNPGEGQFVLSTTFTVNIACDGVGPKLFFDGAVEVPGYLCGNNVVFTHIVSPVDVLRDIVIFENSAVDETFGCANPPADWKQQDVIGYSTSDPMDMFEHGITTGFVDSKVYGSHHDFVIGCRNPPRGAGGKGSWISRGLQFHPGVDDTFRHELTAYKLYATRLAVIAAKPFLKKAEWLALLVPIDAAIYLHGQGKEKLALASVKVLVALNDKVKYRVAGPLEEPRNPHGEVKFRGLNAVDMIDRRTLREGAPSP